MVCCCCYIILVISSVWACCSICATSTFFPFQFLLSYLSFGLAFILWEILSLVLSSLLHLRLVLTASSPLQSCRFLVWLDHFHTCLSNVFCLGHRSQHFQGLRRVLACFSILLSLLDNCLAIPFLPPKRALFKYSYSEISMLLLFHPQKGIIPLSQLENFPYSWLIVLLQPPIALAAFLLSSVSFSFSAISSHNWSYSEKFLDVPLLASILSFLSFLFSFSVNLILSDLCLIFGKLLLRTTIE